MAYQFSLNEALESYYIKSDMDNIVLPNNLGNISIRSNVISNDIFVAKLDMNTNEGFSMLVDTMADTSSMFISIALQDEVYKYNYTAGRGETHFENIITVTYKSRTKNLIKSDKELAAKNVGIMITNSFLEENFFNYLKDERRSEIENNCRDNVATLFKFTLASRKILSLAKEIYNSPFSGQLQKIFLQSKVYDIIYEEFMSIINDQNNKDLGNRIILSQDDIDALHMAKTIILGSNNNFCISELAKKVALNEKKLNDGFKKIFGTTPGLMMFENKMHEAKKLLEESEYNINEIAEITGYKYAQNFTNAFIKFFGKKPSDIMKNRRYYY